MKKIAIGELELDLMETPADINDGRYQVVHQLMDQIYSYVERPDPFRFCQLMRKAINEQVMSAVYETFFNFEASLALAQGQDKRVWSLIFALITLESGEDQTDKKTRDINYLSTKVDRYQVAGMSAELPEKEVQTFFFSCPELSSRWATQTEMMNVMRLFSKLDFSTAVEQEQKPPEN